MYNQAATCKKLALTLLTILAAAPASAQTPSPTQTPATLPSADDLKTLIDKAQYRPALQSLARILELKGDAAANYDRYSLLMLRAECQLQIKELPAAKESLAAARKFADSANKPADSAKTAALELLLARSTSYTYKPKTGNVKDSLNILDLNQRPRALLLLFNDEMAAVQSKYEAALKAKNLPPVIDFAKSAAIIRSLELTVEGNNDKTTALYSGLAKHAAALMDAEADTMNIRAQALKQSAEQLVSEQIDLVDSTGRRFPQTRVRQRGMTDDEKNAVRQISEVCKKYPPAAKELAAALGADPATFDDPVKKAADVAGKCENLLLTDYGVPVR